MNTFSYEFDELPLVMVPGIDAGLINGRAEIEYRGDDDWTIRSIQIEGYQRLSLAERAAGKKPWVYVDAPVPLAVIIAERLTGEWYDKVSSAVMHQVDIDRECAADDFADMRREELAVRGW